MELLIDLLKRVGLVLTRGCGILQRSPSYPRVIFGANFFSAYPLMLNLSNHLPFSEAHISARQIRQLIAEACLRTQSLNRDEIIPLRYHPHRER